MKVLKSSNGFDIMIDDEDYKRVSNYKWNVFLDKTNFLYFKLNFKNNL